jgi:hypothetical protein
MRFELLKVHNSVSTKIGVQRPQTSTRIIAVTKMFEIIYDAMLSTDRLEF